MPLEYAYGWGNEFDGQYAWYSNNSNSRTHAVATKLPISSPQNEADKLYDMAGNVWQWIQDWYGDYLYSNPDKKILWPWVQDLGQGNFLATDPRGSATAGSGRVLRGGGWGFDPVFLRAARRNYYGPGDRGGVIGFRLVRTPK